MYDMADQFKIKDNNTGDLSEELDLPELVDYLISIYCPDINPMQKGYISYALTQAWYSLPNTNFEIANNLTLMAL